MSQSQRFGRSAGVALLLTGLVTACSSGASRHPAIPSGPAVSNGPTIGAARQLVAIVDRAPSTPAMISALATREPDFALRILRAVASSGANVTVSPTSLAIALSMLQNGARGDTESAIAKTLGTSGLSTTAQNEGWAGITDAWSAAQDSGDVTISSANSVWTQSGFKVAAPFLGALGAYYGSGVWQVDFNGANAAATDAINKWTGQHTNGKIPTLFNPGSLPQDTRLVLANAVYFRAAWAQPFNGALTADGPFTTATGSTTNASFMSTTAQLNAAVTDSYNAVQLPYTGGRFSALAIIPKTGSLSSYLSTLTGAGLSSVVSSLQPQSVTVTMPRFQTTSTLPLQEPLTKLGMGIAFTDGANFTGIAPGLKVATVLQRTYLKVAEQGTEAAAATGIVMVPSSAEAGGTPITFDHPFLFLIRDTQTGVVLFASTIGQPQ